MKRVAFVVLFFCSMLLTPSASAQEAGASAEAARELFEEGVAAEQAGRLDIARDKFRESYAVEPRLNTAINLAVALTRLGRLLEAETLLTDLSEAHPDASAADREQIGQLLVLVGEEIAIVELEVEGRDEDEVHVRVDGARMASFGASRRTSLRVDPGRHTLVVTASDGGSTEREIDVARSERIDIVLTLPPPPEALVSNGAADGRGSSLWASPWLWAGVVLVVAAAVAIPIAVASSTDQFTTDPVWGRGEVP